MLTAKLHSLYVEGAGVGNLVKVGTFGKVGVVVGHFTFNSANLNYLLPIFSAIRLPVLCVQNTTQGMQRAPLL